MKFGTRLIHTGNEIDPQTGAVSTPIIMASTFDQPSVEQSGPYDYSRSGNPTRNALEDTIAKLEGGTRGLAFASGMAAISTVLLLFTPGDHLVVANELYGGAYRVLTKLFSRLGITYTFVDTSDLQAIRDAIQPNTKALYLETPSNPLQSITDLREAGKIAREQEIITIVDNTFMTPYLQRPLELGSDIVIHSATKFLGGHSDILAGLVVANNRELATRLYFLQNAFGAVLGPYDSWLLLRSIKTLKVRMDQHQLNAALVADWLKEHPLVTDVYYPGLPGHPRKDIHFSQAQGAGGVVSFKVKTTEMAHRVLNEAELPVTAVSLGAVESILSYPVTMSHAAIPPEIREKMGITPNLIRLSVGLEEAEDLIADLEKVLK